MSVNYVAYGLLAVFFVLPLAAAAIIYAWRRMARALRPAPATPPGVRS